MAALEGRETLRPSGPAAGDLAGQYPAPELRANSVGSPEVAADSLGSADLALDSVGSSELALDSVGSSELKGVTAVVGTGVEIDSGGTAGATVTCPPGSMIIGGGSSGWSPRTRRSFSTPRRASSATQTRHGS